MHSFAGTQSRKLVEAHKKRFMKKPPLRTALDDLASQERKEKENMENRDSSKVTTDDEPPIRAPSKLLTVSTNYSTDSSVDDNFRRPCPTGSGNLKKAKYQMQVKGSRPLDVEAKVPGKTAEESQSEEGETSGDRETKGAGEKHSPILFSSHESKDIAIPL